ncbi:MAG: FecR domain-containing protein [Cyclobacteriaceae bacterium]
MKKEQYIEKWINGTLSEDEKASFKTSTDFESLEKFSKAALSKTAPEYKVEKELERLLQRRPGKVVRMNWTNSLLKIAAVLLVLIGAGYIFLTNDTPISKETISLAKESFFLPDSSQVILNTHSELKYLKSDWTNERLVELKGEGFFKVSTGSRFEVITESGSVKVLGTEFNVKIRENYFEVVCYEGSVEVESSQEKYTLKRGQMFREINDVITQSQISSSGTPSWIEGESTFLSIPLMQVVGEFERQYNVSLDTEGLDVDQKYTGRFTHNDIDLALQAITTPLNLEYEIIDNHVILRK